MKKFKIIGLTVTLSIIFSVLYGCAVSPHAAVDCLSSEQATEIRDIIYNERYGIGADKTKIVIKGCRCIYDDMPIFIFNDNNDKNNWENAIYVLLTPERAVDGKRIFTLPDAYKNGALTRSDAYEIVKLYNGETPDNTEVTGLSAEKLQDIRRAYFEVQAVSFKDEYDMRKFSITACYGTYGGQIVFNSYDDNYLYSTEVVNIVIDGVYIRTAASGRDELLVCLNTDKGYGGDRVVTLQCAYEQGFLTKDNLYEISEAVNS